MEKEIFKDIIGYEGMYKIGSKGTCLTFRRNKAGAILKPVKCTNGYLEYQLTYKGVRKVFLAHRLVALHFIPNPDNLPEVNHLDENIVNNDYKNLRWCTSKENANYGTRNERCKKNNPQLKPVIQFDKDLNYIKTWDCLSDAAREYNVGNENISRCCKGKRKTSAGFIWYYKYEDIQQGNV